MARYTLQFLNAYLKHDSAAMEYLKKTPAENGASRHFMTVNYRAAKGVPASFDGFRGELGRQGFDRAADVYSALQKEKPGFTLDETAVNSWSSELMLDNHFAEAIDLLKLNVPIHPGSGDAYENLGDAYKQSGQKQLAIDNYRKSLEKAPGNDSAKQKLKDLENTPAAR